MITTMPIPPNAPFSNLWKPGGSGGKTRPALATIPSLFTNHLVVGDSVDGEPAVIRDIDSNQIVLRPGKEGASTPSISLPFHYSSDLMVEMLSDTLKRPVEEIKYPLASTTPDGVQQ